MFFFQKEKKKKKYTALKVVAIIVGILALIAGGAYMYGALLGLFIMIGWGVYALIRRIKNGKIRMKKYVMLFYAENTRQEKGARIWQEKSSLRREKAAWEKQR